MWGERVVLSYRVYVLEEGGHIRKAPAVLDCEDDAEAIQRAKQLLDGKPIEVWEGARVVIKLQPKK